MAIQKVQAGFRLFRGEILNQLIAQSNAGANFTAQTTDPGPTNDASQGFIQGSIWYNSTAGALRLWECYVNTTGAAGWMFIGADYANGGTNPNGEVTQFGLGAASMGEEGNVSRQVPGVTSGVQPGATGADNVIGVYSIPASSFDQSGRGVTMTAAGNFAATANNKRCKLIINPATAVLGSTVGAGGITIADTGTVAQNGGAWVLMGSLFKRGALASNTQLAVPGGVMLSGSHVGASAACQEVTATESGAILLAVTGNATTATTDILLAFFEVNAMN